MRRRIKQTLVAPLVSRRTSDRVFNAIVMFLGPPLIANYAFEIVSQGWRISLCDGILFVGLGVWAVVLWTQYLRRGVRRMTRGDALAWQPADCPRCRYDLRGSTSVTCPECGCYLGTRKRAHD